MRRLFRQFSFPGGIPSHVAPETPGSIHEGGELGYSLVARLRRGVRQSRPASSPAWSATARPRPARWRPAGTRNKFLNPARDGAVLPILHLNGYKIANPTVLARIARDELAALLRRLRLRRRTSSRATSPRAMHQLMAATLDDVRRRDRRDPAAAPASDGGDASARAGR